MIELYNDNKTGIDYINLDDLFSFKNMSNVMEFLIKYDLDYVMIKNGKYLTLETAFATFDAYGESLNIISTIPRKKIDLRYCRLVYSYKNKISRLRINSSV